MTDYDDYDDEDEDPGDGTSSDGDQDEEPLTNKKLQAIRNVKAAVTSSKKDLDDWVTTSQAIPSVNQPATTNPAILIGGESYSHIAEGLNENAWKSPKADEYATWISSVTTAISTMMDTMVSNLKDAEQYQESEIGMNPPPDSEEANWPVAT